MTGLPVMSALVCSQRGDVLDQRQVRLDADEDARRGAEQRGMGHRRHVDQPACQQSLQVLAYRALSYVQLAGNFDVGHPAIALQQRDDPAICVIRGVSHGPPRRCGVSRKMRQMSTGGRELTYYYINHITRCEIRKIVSSQ